jgi:hypothetical protein
MTSQHSPMNTCIECGRRRSYGDKRACGQQAALHARLLHTLDKAEGRRKMSAQTVQRIRLLHRLDKAEGRRIPRRGRSGLQRAVLLRSDLAKGQGKPEHHPALLSASYEQLHTEINQRLDLRQSILTFTLLVAASLFGLGLQSWANAVTVLCYPVLALFLAMIWGQHDLKIGQIAAYLQEIEDALLPGSLGWERWRRVHFQVKHYRIEVPAKGVFLVSETLAIVIGLARFLEQTATIGSALLFVGLLTTDLVAFLLTALALKHYRLR